MVLRPDLKDRSTPSVIFVDLDGTLILDNSYSIFLIQCLSCGSPGLRRKIGWIVARRLTGSVDRVEMKRRVLLAFATEPEPTRQRILQRTVAQMRRTLSVPILEMIDGYRDAGARIVVATAAPDLYVGPFCAALDIDDFISTSSSIDPKWHENFSSKKAVTCSQWLLENAPSAPVIVATDSCDDLQLAELASTVVFQGPAERYTRFAQALPATIPIIHIDSSASQAGGGYWLWFDDGPSGPHDQWEVRTILSKHRYALVYRERGGWGRVASSRRLASASRRVTCPIPPPLGQRLAASARHRFVHDFLRLTH